MNNKKHYHPTIAEIDLRAFSLNLEKIRKWVGDKKKIIPIVKADAYGHGMVEIAKRAILEGYHLLGVGNFEEGYILRNSGIKADILVLDGCFTKQEDLFVQNNLKPVVYSNKTIRRLAESAKRFNRKIPIHIKVDTGMGRLGYAPAQLKEAIALAINTKGIQIEGLVTHFASAFENDVEFTNRQIGIINGLIKEIEEQGVNIPIIHTSNSAGILFFPNSHFNAVRPGIMLYGINPSNHGPLECRMEPVMKLKTKIIQIKNVSSGVSISYGRSYITKRKSRIAVLPIGYGDGYSRALSNKSEVLIKGKRISQVGIICMDLCMVDVTDFPDIVEGDEVVLFGKQKKEMISADELAKWSQTIPYEVFCQIGKRVKREYINQ